MQKGKKRLIILLSLLVIVASIFIIFHDNADVEQIEKAQLQDISEKVPEKFDDLNASFEEELQE